MKTPTALFKVIFSIALGSLLLAAGIVAGVQYFGKRAAAEAAKKLSEAAQTAAQIPVPPPPPPKPAGVRLANVVLNGAAAQNASSLQELSALTDPQPEAVHLLTEAINSSSPTVATNALSGLAALAGKNPESVGAIASALEKPALKASAIQTLGALGPQAAAALPALKKIAANKREPKSLRKASASAIAKIQLKPVSKKKISKKKTRTAKPKR